MPGGRRPPDAMTELVDTHIHFFRPGLPVAASPRYLPDYAAEPASYLELARIHGITRAVVVQPSFYGSDNSHLCAVLRRHPGLFRGIAVIGPEAGEQEIEQLAADGVVGIRLNLDGRPLPDFARGGWPALLRRLRELQWQVELHRDASDLPRLIPPLVDAGVRVVVDHFGRPDAGSGASDPGFRALLQSARSGQVWVKLSGAYRNGPQGVGRAAAMAGELLEYFGPQRLVWGSDWPHTRHEAAASMQALLAQLDLWIPDAAARRQILGATALELFRFGINPP
jgi:predicted TIM-barrel fold metal-dependent hydrolase